MTLNSNHIFEEIANTKCSVIEKNCNSQRMEFLKTLLEYNGFKVITASSSPPKAISKETDPAISEEPTSPATSELFTIGVTDLSFNVMNAIYNRELLTPEGHVVSPDYWRLQDKNTFNDSWYWKK